MPSAGVAGAEGLVAPLPQSRGQRFLAFGLSPGLVGRGQLLGSDDGLGLYHAAIVEEAGDKMENRPRGVNGGKPLVQRDSASHANNQVESDHQRTRGRGPAISGLSQGGRERGFRTF